VYSKPRKKEVRAATREKKTSSQGLQRTTAPHHPAKDGRQQQQNDDKTDRQNKPTNPTPPSPTTHTNAIPPSPPPPSTNITILKYPPKRGGRPHCRRRGPVKAGSRPTPTTYRSEWGASLRALSLLSKTWPHQTLPTIPHATHASTSTNPRAAPPNKPQLRVARVRGLSQIPAQG
jgi:hypothetical protein